MSSQHIFRSLLSAFLLIAFSVSARGAEMAQGVVFHDRNENGKRDAGEPGIPNVRVSNQKDVVTTDKDGRWELPSGNDIIFFVIKPSGWKTPLNEFNLPQFHYVHKPAGSPKTRYLGVKPTGPLPKSIDFPLMPQKEPDTFKAIFFGDPQPSNQQHIDYIAHDVVEELIGTDAKFGITLGDILFDNLSLFDSLNSTVALIGVPWYNVIGNHDINMEATTDALSDETFERVYGPTYYSFDYGKVHFIVLDNVMWAARGAKYVPELGPRQVEFVKNDLKLVPEKQLVVLMMHIPLRGMIDRQQLYRLIEQRPYTLSLSGHTHTQEHHFIGKEEGWRGKTPHHHIVNVTVSGSWWKGSKDELGIPHTTMRDGSPNGHSIITFDGHSATFDFKAARRPADYQMNIHAPEVVAAATAHESSLYVNVFSGSVKSKVRFRVGNSKWTTMKKVQEKDPYYTAVRERDMKAFPKAPALNPPANSTHLWKSPLPKGLKTGTHLIRVETTDMYGRTFKDAQVIRVR
ncbi:MAG: metallophosphoesterase [Verrucomicrobiales bacterium]|nr:metallophosphoesterase [Verrucomicrobiales bacterium]